MLLSSLNVNILTAFLPLGTGDPNKKRQQKTATESPVFLTGKSATSPCCLFKTTIDAPTYPKEYERKYNMQKQFFAKK